MHMLHRSPAQPVTAETGKTNDKRQDSPRPLPVGFQDRVERIDIGCNLYAGRLISGLNQRCQHPNVIVPAVVRGEVALVAIVTVMIVKLVDIERNLKLTHGW